MTTTHRAIRRRLTLLASSSGAIALMAAAGGAATLAPTKAMALIIGCGERSGPAPIFCINTDPSGPAGLSVGSAAPVNLSGSPVGIVAAILNSANPDDVNVTLGDGSTISASQLGIIAANFGVGDTSIQVGSNVAFQGMQTGVLAISNARTSISVGDNFGLDLTSPDFVDRMGLVAQSQSAADADAPSAEVTLGDGATLTSGGFLVQDSYLVSVQALNGNASAKITIGDDADLAISGEYVAGVYAQTNLGDIDIAVGTGAINVVGGGSMGWWWPHPISANAGIYADSAGGDVTVSSAADIAVDSNETWEAGIWASAGGAGNVSVTSDGNIVSTWHGIEATVADGALNISSTGDLDALLAIDGYASGGGSVTIFSSGQVHGNISGVAQTGPVSVHTTGNILANGMAIYAQGFGKVTVVADGNLGSADERVYQGVEANSGTWFNPVSDDVNVTVNGDVYAASPFLDAAISATVMGDAGSATVNFGQSRAAILDAGFKGLVAQVYPMGHGDATVTVGDGSTIIATLGAQALANSSGDATVQLGSNVTLDQTLLGAFASSRGRSLVSAGDNLTLTMQSSAFNPQRVGLYAHTTALADDGSPSAEVDVGNNATIINTDTSTFDGAGIYAESFFGAASSRVTVGDGLNVQMAGEYVAGVAGYAYLGDVDVTVGSGSIVLTGGDPVSFPTIAPANGAIIADARGGNVSVTSAADMSVTSNGAPAFGIDAFTTGSGDVTVTSSGAITSSGLGIGASVVDGRIAIDNSGSVSGATTGILATTTGAGSISLTSSGSVQGADAAIDVSTLTGDIVVDATGALSGDVGLRAVSQDGIVRVGATGGVTAVTTGIDATAHGSGALTVRAGGVQAGGIGVLATTDTSNIRVVAVGDVSAGTGSAIDANSGAMARVDVAAGATVSSTAPSISIDAVGAASINNHGTIRSTAGRPRDVVIDVDAASATLNNTGTLHGAVDFSGAGSLAFVNTGLWRTALLSEFTAGSDSLDNTGVIAIHGTTIDFGGGADLFTNAGTLLVGDSSGAATLTLANLETFDNSGLILFGSRNGQTSDRETNDRLVAQSTAFTGSGASTLAMDVDLGGASQANCSAATVADCFDLTGGSTAGSTLIRVTDTGQSAGALNTAGIVLVDVHGGTSHAADFTLDPMSSGYAVDPTLGAGLEKGLFLYQLDYDAANARHRLVSLPNSRAFEFAPLAASAQSVWYTSVGSWFDRQADLRDTLAAGDTGPGVWIKMAGANDNRDATVDYGPYAFNISNKQNTVAALAGIDLLHGAGEGQGYVVGLTAGNLNSDVQFKASHRSAKLEGQSYGAYATWLSNSFFLDAIVQQNDLDLRDNAAFGAKGKVKSTGGQVEGGWRMPFASLSVEPLASLAYVRTKFDDLALPGATLHTEEAKSLRGSLGGRVSGDTDLHSATLKWQATGRVWDEFEGKNRAVLISNGQSVGMPDDVSGVFGDVGVGVSLYSPTGHVSTFLNTGLKFKDDYRSTNTAVGFRVQW